MSISSTSCCRWPWSFSCSSDRYGLTLASAGRRRAPKPPKPHSPVSIGLKLVLDAATAAAAYVGLVIFRPAILALVEERVENPAAHIALDFVTSAVRANALARFEVAEGGGVDAEARHPQEGNHATVELNLPDVERGDAAVLTCGSNVLTSQLQDLLAHVREARRWKGSVVVGTLRGGIVRHQTGLLLEEFAGVGGLFRGHAHRQRSRHVVAGSKDGRRVSALNRDGIAGHFQGGPDQVCIHGRRRLINGRPLAFLTRRHRSRMPEASQQTPCLRRVVLHGQPWNAVPRLRTILSSFPPLNCRSSSASGGSAGRISRISSRRSTEERATTSSRRPVGGRTAATISSCFGRPPQSWSSASIGLFIRSVCRAVGSAPGLCRKWAQLEAFS